MSGFGLVNELLGKIEKWWVRNILSFFRELKTITPPQLP